MSELLSGVASLSVLTFVVTSMLAVGLSYSWREIVGPLRNIGGVVKALVANFILVPLLTFLILWLFSLPESYAVGLFLVAAGAGAAFLIKLSQVSDIDVALAAALLVLLMPATVIYMALVVPIVMPEVDVSTWAIGSPLVWTLLLPLGGGLVVHARWPKVAGRLQPIMNHTSTVALVALVITLILANLEAIADIFGTGAILAALLIVGGAFVTGYAMGGSRRDARKVLGFATAQRNYGAAMVVASQTLEDPQALVMVVVTSIVGMALLFPIAWYLKRRELEPDTTGRDEPMRGPATAEA